MYRIKEVNFVYTIWKIENKKDQIIMNKDGRYLILDKPSDTSKSFRYDLSTGEFERINYYKTKDIKFTPVKVNNITRWFTFLQPQAMAL